MVGNKLESAEKWILAGIPILFLLGSLFHFLYDFSGNNKIIALIAPVNESVWEHLKMVPVPMFLYWIISYFILNKQGNVNKNKWFTGALVSMVTALLTIPLLFYFYTGAFGVELLWVDILLLFAAVSFGQILALHFYRHSKGIVWYIPFAIMIFIIIIFGILTYFPIHIPMFKDSETGLYGIASE